MSVELGERVTVTEGGPDREHADVRYEGVVVAMERTGTTMELGDGTRWPGIRFRIRLDDGTHRWTKTHADKPLRGLGSQQEGGEV